MWEQNLHQMWNRMIRETAKTLPWQAYDVNRIWLLFSYASLHIHRFHTMFLLCSPHYLVTVPSIMQSMWTYLTMPHRIWWLSHLQNNESISSFLTSDLQHQTSCHKKFTDCIFTKHCHYSAHCVSSEGLPNPLFHKFNLLLSSD